jgi:phage/plasmid-like protein (TIGR03299 family)
MENKKDVELLTASECIVKYGLGWQVLEKPVSVGGVVLEDYKAIVRGDNGYIFQVAGRNYEPIQNTEVFNFFDEIVSMGGAKYEKAFTYKNGGVVNLRVRLPYDFEVLPNDRLNTCLDIVTSHDGSLALSVMPRIYRQICTNGMHAWVNDYSKRVAVKHTPNARYRFISNAKDILAAEVEYFARFKEASQKLAGKIMSSLEVDQFLTDLFKLDNEASTRAKNQADDVRHLIERGTGQDIAGVRGTAWSVYNGVTEYVDKYRSTKGDAENRAYSADFGSGAVLRERAFALLTR